MKDKSLAIAIFIYIIAIIMVILFGKTKVTYENGTSETMLFVEAVSLIVKEE